MPGQVLSTKLFHEAVIAAAAAYPRLRPESVVDELERRLRVVVQSAHHPRVDDVRHPERIEIRQHRVEVLLGLIGEVIEHQGRRGGHLADLWALVVEHAQRVDLGTPTRVLVEIEAEEELLQQLPVLRSARIVAERGDLEAKTIESQ